MLTPKYEDSFFCLLRWFWFSALYIGFVYSSVKLYEILANDSSIRFEILYS